jgi:UDP-glucose 4-epimerase
MRYLVTGGAGFIGSHLCRELLRRGDQVVAVDDLSTGVLGNIEPLSGDRRFRFVRGDCADRPLMEGWVADCDAIVHLAASVGVKRVIESPLRTIETNVQGTATVLALASARARPVLLTSSSEVYGKSAAVPFREDADLVLGPPVQGRWSYACSKALDEFLALAYWKEKGLPAVVVRLFNTVGPRQTGRYGMALPSFVSQGLAGEDITVYGDGSQSRCFTHVADVVDALLLLLASERHFGEVYNVGSAEEVTIRELAAAVRSATGERSRVVFVPYAAAYAPGFEEVPRRVPDLGKIAAATGWRAIRRLPQILSDVVADARRAPIATAPADPRG